MKYKEANDRLHAGAELKNKTVAAMEGSPVSRRKKPDRIVRGGALVAAVLAVVMMIRLPLPGGGGGAMMAYAVSEAEYPVMAPAPNEMDYIDKVTGEFDDESFSAAWEAWRNSQKALRTDPVDEAYLAALADFSHTSIRQILTGGKEPENRVYSPVNLYVALAMLAELADGQSRQQVLDALGVTDLDTLREQTNRIWKRLYCDDGQRTTRLANSLWLNEHVTYEQGTLDTLAEDYYASTYQGEMGTRELDKALQDWVNAQTGGLLEDSVANLTTQPQTVLALLSTVYFQGRWSNEFNADRTEPGDFTGADGTVSQVDFMHSNGFGHYAWGEHFSAITLSFEGGVGMTLMLPDEGVTTDRLLGDGEAMALLCSSSGVYASENNKYLRVILSMPKFDVSSDLVLNDQLKALGMTDVFDSAVSDFSPLTSLKPVWLDKVSHAARVAVDEEGCTAASYVAMMMAGGAAPPKDEVEFTLDRPFLFAITGLDGLPLFVGEVNQLN